MTSNIFWIIFSFSFREPFNLKVLSSINGQSELIKKQQVLIKLIYMVICFGSTIQFLISVIYYKWHRLKTEWFIQKLVKMKIGWRRVISNHGISHSIFAYFKQNYKGKRNYMWNFSIKIIVKVRSMLYRFLQLVIVSLLPNECLSPCNFYRFWY